MIWLLALVCLVLGAACVVLALMLRQSAELARAETTKLNEAATRLAAAHEDARRRLKAVSDSSQAGILMLDDRGVILSANPAVERLFDARGDLEGQTVIAATMSKVLHDFIAEHARTGASGERTIRLPGVNGRSLRVGAYPSSNGAREVLIVVHDITELKRLETVRRDFVANVSHEMRTPLTSIRAMAETLHAGAREDKATAERFLETIIREADRLARISEDLLVLSNAESKEPQKEHFNLALLIQDVVARYRLPASKLGISLERQVPERVDVLASRDQIEQVLVNLVDNAIKYTPSGGAVEVSASVEDETTILRVRDTGIGIMQEDIPRIFERFYRVDKARSRESGGTGLGLSIVKNIVEAHGGEVAVESEYNHGTTFTAVIPN